MENVIQKDEEDIKNAIGYKAINEYLQKYKVMTHLLSLPFHVLELFYLKGHKNSRDGNQALKYRFHP